MLSARLVVQQDVAANSISVQRFAEDILSKFEWVGGYYQSCRCKVSWSGSGRVCVSTATWRETVAATTLWPPGTAQNTLCSLTATPVPSPSCSQRPQCCEEPRSGGAWNRLGRVGGPRTLAGEVGWKKKTKQTAFLSSVFRTCDACCKSSVLRCVLDMYERRWSDFVLKEDFI